MHSEQAHLKANQTRSPSSSPFPLGASPTFAIKFHLGLLHTILNEWLGIFEARDDKLE